MATWPASLPTQPRVEGFSPSRRRPTRDFIPDQKRRISRIIQSTANKIWSGTYRMSEAQQTAFWNFWENDINFGLDAFTMTDPQTGVSVTAEFMTTEPPVFRAVSYDLYDVDLAIEVVG